MIIGSIERSSAKRAYIIVGNARLTKEENVGKDWIYDDSKFKLKKVPIINNQIYCSSEVSGKFYIVEDSGKMTLAHFYKNFNEMFLNAMLFHPDKFHVTKAGYLNGYWTFKSYMNQGEQMFLVPHIVDDITDKPYRQDVADWFMETHNLVRQSSSGVKPALTWRTR